MLTKEEARFRVMEYVVEMLSPEQIEETSFITDLSETEQDAELLRETLEDIRQELSAEMEKLA